MFMIYSYVSCLIHHLCVCAYPYVLSLPWHLDILVLHQLLEFHQVHHVLLVPLVPLLLGIHQVQLVLLVLCVPSLLAVLDIRQYRLVPLVQLVPLVLGVHQVQGLH